MNAARRHDRGRRVTTPVALFVAAMSITHERVLAQSSREAVDTAQQARVDALFTAFAEPGAPGAAVVVARGDSIVFARGYGLADVEHSIGVTPSTSFRLASVTKQFTAAAILTLVEAGKLRLDDTVGDVLDDMPVYARDVRVRHLLAHTSGIPRLRSVARQRRRPPARGS